MSSQNGYNPFFNSHAICKFNGVHVNESNRYAVHFIRYQLISISETATGECAASVLERWVSLTTFNEDDCVLSICDFQFHSRQFACRLAEEILSYSSAVTRVALALSYLTVTYHIAYKTLSHVYYFNILGGVKLAYVVSTTRCIYTCPVSSGMRPRPPPEVV